MSIMLVDYSTVNVQTSIRPTGLEFATIEDGELWVNPLAIDPGF